VNNQTALARAAATRPEKVRVAIADDNEGVRTLLEVLIELDGRMELVGTAGDGREALKLVATGHPDVILLDLSMPLLDGLQVLETLRKDHPETRVVVYSGFSGAEVQAAAFEAGAADYLVKGVEPEVIIERLLAASR
jgi:DNA-binding NarL/FixJ family response regulator